MTRFSQIICAATVILAAAATPALADPINIISGSLVMEWPGGNTGPVNLVGTRGFTMTGGAGFFTGIGLFDQCGLPECPPGASVEFNLGLSGSSGAIFGVMTVDGNQFAITDSQDANANLLLHFGGSFIAPAMGPAQATVSAPFSLTGQALAVDSVNQTAVDDQIFGHGIGTVTLLPYNPAAGFPPSWVARRVRFDFLQPTPEPSTLLLIGTGTLVPLIRKRRRSQTDASSSM
jgi:hypothetical protein